MRRVIISIFGIILLFSACKKETIEGYWKITFVADVDVVLLPPSAGCYHSGFIGAVLYFPVEGGEVVHQESFVTVDTIVCNNCGYAEMVSNTKNIPITMNARLDVQAVEIGDAEGNVTAVFDDFSIWMENPVTYSIDVYYSCGGTPATTPDYGNAVSQLTGPFIYQVWNFSPQFDQIHTSSKQFSDYPVSGATLNANLTFRIYEEYVAEY